jgi:hypothetical protein
MLTKHHSKKQESIIDIQIQLKGLGKKQLQLSVSLLSNSQEIVLKNHRYYFRDVKDKDQVSIHKNVLKQQYDAALEDENLLNQLFAHINTLAQKTNYIEKKAISVIYYLTMLIDQYNMQGQFKASKQVTRFYIDNLQPLLSHLSHSKDVNKNHYIVISQSLVATVRLNDLEYQQTVLEMLGNNFDINAIENSTLVYNLACYYAVKKDKNRMLNAIKKSRAMGKPSTQFVNDSDFQFYLKDDYFLDAIK